MYEIAFENILKSSLVFNEAKMFILTENTIFDAVANKLNPFHLNTITIPMKGLKCPFNKLGYWGYRGTYINTFVEKII